MRRNVKLFQLLESTLTNSAWLWGGDLDVIEFVAIPSAPVPCSRLPPRLIDQQSAHRLRSRSEEVSPAVPMVVGLAIDEADIDFMNKSRGLKRLAGSFLSHLLRRQSPQLVIDQRQQILGGVWVAQFDRRQDLCDLVQCGRPESVLRRGKPTL
jgi:hypothetical protein